MVFRNPASYSRRVIEASRRRDEAKRNKERRAVESQRKKEQQKLAKQQRKLSEEAERRRMQAVNEDWKYSEQNRRLGEQLFEIGSGVPHGFTNPSKYVRSLKKFHGRVSGEYHGQKITFVNANGGTNVGGISLYKIRQRVGAISELKTESQFHQDLYDKNYYFTLPPKSPEYRTINQVIPAIRRILMKQYEKSPLRFEFQRALDSFYVAATATPDLRPKVEYMNKNMWARFERLKKVANTVLQKQGKASIL